MIFDTQGIVLNKQKYGDSSLVVHIYTSEFGRQTYFVRGAFSKKNAKAKLLRPFFVLQMAVYHKEKKNIQNIKEFALAFPLQSVPFNVYKSTQALFISEVLYKVLKEEDKNEELFEFISQNIQYLDLIGGNAANFYLSFLFRLTRFLGFFPQLNFDDENCVFDLANGCFVPEERKHGHCLSKSLSKLAFHLFSTTVVNSDELKINGEIRELLLSGILNFYALHIDGFTSLKSLEVMKEIFAD